MGLCGGRCCNFVPIQKVKMFRTIAAFFAGRLIGEKVAGSGIIQPEPVPFVNRSIFAAGVISVILILILMRF